MPYYIHEGWGSIHWACKNCLVRPMCTERCYKTYLKHYLCDGCGDSCTSFPCKKVETSQMYEVVFNAYGDMIIKEMIKHQEKTSIFRLP